ncbi:MAG TPA: DUF924 family protein [Alphaproteobacteria bacterium]|nr:DUF924 family protein [Alphaproteobacteria bacterium]
MTSPADILAFWFDEAGPAAWYRRDPAFDALIRDRFGALVEEALAGRLDGWAETPDGLLALVVLLDQFPRNLFRDDPRAYAGDPKARALAHRALADGLDAALPPPRRQFLYMPLMHSEDVADQALCVEKFAAMGEPDALFYARLHHAIVERYGRFPHRNAALGRADTPDEARFMATLGIRF